MKFPDKDRHQLFLEPEGLETREIYVNGLSTSLPIDIQLEVIRRIPGLESAEMMRPGYAIEYDYVPPTQLTPWLETKIVYNLFHAGQINGTSGYEEAAGQGILAGINAVLKIRGKSPFILSRSESYLGVMIDDLVNFGTSGEPYRMFTSRAEYRLLLREDNADLRLREFGRSFGLVGDEDYQGFIYKKRLIEEIKQYLIKIRLTPTPTTNHSLLQIATPQINHPTTLFELLRRPGITLANIATLNPEIQTKIEFLTHEIIEQVEIQTKYSGYIERQTEDIRRVNKFRDLKFPSSFCFDEIPGLSREVVEKLKKLRPHSIDQASRISGITPAAISILMLHLKRYLNFSSIPS
jgi:tRNA uridine 5-carboxymethylaminomethyl modification enzyme